MPRPRVLDHVAQARNENRVNEQYYLNVDCKRQLEMAREGSTWPGELLPADLQ